MTSDSDLLRQYADHGDEAAFAEVVRRQADLVYSVALRVTANPALAQEVTQTVFTLLARNAKALSHYDTLVGWLHPTARHTAINAVRGEERRRAREHEAATMQDTTTAPEMNWESIGPLLDEAVGTLREDDRKAVLLRFFKNLSHQEVGAALGLSEDTARKRVERALEKLRAHFTSRGVTASSALLAVTITANSVQAAPVGLVGQITPAALTAAGTASGVTVFTYLTMIIKSPAFLAVALTALVATGVVFGLRAAPFTEAAPKVATATATSLPPPVLPSVPVASAGIAAAPSPKANSAVGSGTGEINRPIAQMPTNIVNTFRTEGITALQRPEAIAAIQAYFNDSTRFHLLVDAVINRDEAIKALMATYPEIKSQSINLVEPPMYTEPPAEANYAHDGILRSMLGQVSPEDSAVVKNFDTELRQDENIQVAVKTQLAAFASLRDAIGSGIATDADTQQMVRDNPDIMSYVTASFMSLLTSRLHPFPGNDLTIKQVTDAVGALTPDMFNPPRRGARGAPRQNPAPRRGSATGTASPQS